MKKNSLTLRISIALNFLLIIFIITACLWQYKSHNASVPIDKITKEDLENPISRYYKALDYDGRIYTSVLLENNYNVTADYQNSLGKELGTVIKTDDCWMLGDMEEGVQWGTLYQLKGYDDEYRLAIVQGGDYGSFIVLDCINGVTLNTGKDIFVSRMGLDKYVSYYAKAFENDEEELSSLMSALTDSVISVTDAGYRGSINEEYMDDFLNELYNAPVLTLNDAIRAATKDCRFYKLVFTNEYGINDEITIYESGYAKYENAFDALYFDVADTARILFLYFDSGLTFTKDELIPTDVVSETTALISIKRVENFVSSASYGIRLYYNGGLYGLENVERYNIYDIYEENIIDEELGKIYGHKDGAWSMKADELPGVHITGTLYKVRGYSTAEKVAIIYETKQGMMLYILDRQ